MPLNKSPTHTRELTSVAYQQQKYFHTTAVRQTDRQQSFLAAPHTAAATARFPLCITDTRVKKVSNLCGKSSPALWPRTVPASGSAPLS